MAWPYSGSKAAADHLHFLQHGLVELQHRRIIVWIVDRHPIDLILHLSCPSSAEMAVDDPACKPTTSSRLCTGSAAMSSLLRIAMALVMRVSTSGRSTTVTTSSVSMMDFVDGHVQRGRLSGTDRDALHQPGLIPDGPNPDFVHTDGDVEYCEDAVQIASRRPGMSPRARY